MNIGRNQGNPRIIDDEILGQFLKECRNISLMVYIKKYLNIPLKKMSWKNAELWRAQGKLLC